MKKYLIPILVIAVLITGAVAYTRRSRTPVASTRDCPESLTKQALSRDVAYQSTLYCVAFGNTNALIFAVKEEGNKNSLGDIIWFDGSIYSVVSSFNTTPFEFGKTVSVLDDHRVRYVETLLFGGGDSFSQEKILNLKDAGENINLPSLNDSEDAYLKRHSLPKPVSWNEYRTANVRINDTSVQFERHISDSIGNQYPTETWQYNLQSKTYTLVN